MKKTLILVLGSLLLLPTLGFSGIVTFKVGYFIPRAQSDLWTTEFDQMTFDRSHYQNTNFGFTYEYFLNGQISLALSIDGYTKNKAGQYEGYVGYEYYAYHPDYNAWVDFAFPDNYRGEFLPTHIFNIAITPLQLSLKLTPLGRKGKLIPYLGGGVGIYLWSVRLSGDMIDFSDEWIYTDPDDGDISVYPILRVDAREDSRVAFGYHGFGGIMVPVAPRFTVEIEFKYNRVEGVLKEGFEGFEPFDLGGYQISLGVNYWF